MIEIFYPHYLLIRVILRFNRIFYVVYIYL